MADEEKRSDDEKSGESEEARPEATQHADEGKQAEEAEAEAARGEDAGAAAEVSAEGGAGSDPKAAEQVDAAEPTDGAEDAAAEGAEPQGVAGMSQDVEAASPLEPTPGITQDSDSAGATAKPATEQGEEHAGTSHQKHAEHGLAHTASMQVLFGVFGALVILTILTVAVTAIDLGGQGNFIIAMIIATIKAGLVMAFFMHMLWDSKFNVTVFVSSFLFVLLFLAMSLADRAEYQDMIDGWETSQAVEEG